MLKKILTIVVMVLCAFALFSTEIITGEKSVKENRVIDKDMILAGETVEFSGKGKALYLFGQDVLLSGEASDSLVAVGKNIDVFGNVSNHFYSIGQKIYIKGNVSGTSFFLGEELIIDKNSVINGDIFFAGATLKIQGTVNGDVYAGVGRVIINGIVNGNMKLDVGTLSINDEGRINGNLHYTSDSTLSNSEIEKVKGKSEFKKSNHKHVSEKWKEDGKKGFKIFGMIISFFMMISFIISGLLINLFPSAKSFENERTNKQFWNHLLWGLIPFFIYPVAVIFFIVFGITFPIGLTLLLAGIPLLLLTQIFGATLFGQFLFRNFKWSKKNRFLFFLFGTLFFAILSSVNNSFT